LSDKTKIVQSELQFIGEQTDIIASYRDFAMRLVNGFGENADAERSKKIVKIFENFISEEAYRRVSDADVDDLKQIHWTVLGRILFGLERDGKIDAQLIKKIKDALKVHEQKPVQEILPEKLVSASVLGALFAKQHHPKKIPLFDMDKASFRVNNIQRIERIYDEDDIAGKMFDFSRSTITQLLKEGYDDASKQLKTSMTVAQTEKPGMWR